MLRLRPIIVSHLHFHTKFGPVDSLLIDANNGVDEIVEEQRPIAIRHGVSFGDLYVVRAMMTWRSVHSPAAFNSPVRSVSPTAWEAPASNSWPVGRTFHS